MNPSEDPRWAYALVPLSTLLWASNVMLGRALRSDIGPFTLTAFRFTVAAVFFLLLLRRFPPKQRRPGGDWPILLLMGLVGVFIFPTLYYLGLRETQASDAALINGTAPLITVILAALFLGEKLSPLRILATLISLFGVAIVIGGIGLGSLFDFSANRGDAIILLGVIVWGIYSIISRLATRTRDALPATALSSLMVLPLLWAAAFWESHTLPLNLNLNVALAGIYIGIFPTLIGFFSWNEGIRRVGPGRAMAFYNLLPVFGVILGVIFLGEKLTWAHLLGGVLVILGGVLAAAEAWSPKTTASNFSPNT